jgi:hemerythrin superfamily protein
MDAIELLTQQHREVSELFEAIEKAEASEEKTRLFQQLAGKLVGHDGIERELFYPACEEAMGMNDLLGEALVEHGVVEFGLYEADQATGKPDFDYKVKVLKELVEHHVEEEEKEFFPKVRKALGDDKLQSLGEDLEDAFEDAQAEDYHGPLFENLRQVLAGVLQPSVKEPAKTKGRGRSPSGARRSA